MSSINWPWLIAFVGVLALLAWRGHRQQVARHCVVDWCEGYQPCKFHDADGAVTPYEPSY